MTYSAGVSIPSNLWWAIPELPKYSKDFIYGAMYELYYLSIYVHVVVHEHWVQSSCSLLRGKGFHYGLVCMLPCIAVHAPRTLNYLNFFIVSPSMVHVWSIGPMTAPCFNPQLSIIVISILYQIHTYVFPQHIIIGP